MENLITSVPTWVSILFLMVIPIPVFMIANLVKQGAIEAQFSAQKSKQFYWIIVIFYAVYLSYVTFLTFTGVFLTPSIPPKIVLFTTAPLMGFLIFVVSNLNVYKTLLEHTKLESMVKIHIFRLIGAFFILVYIFGAIPAPFAFVAGLGDIITALLSIIVANAIINKKSYAKKLTIAWNIFGILDIVSVLIAAIITTKMAMETGSQSVVEISKFPFSLIPAFAAATILFLHISVFRKLKTI
ncbi:MAG: hypothetical protein EAZ53_02175 [Bacteroidetes bacterium]|nr:MAG: hypothetical protein EAZ53_02175 [Bacteroidota bacterium]